VQQTKNIQSVAVLVGEIRLLMRDRSSEQAGLKQANNGAERHLVQWARDHHRWTIEEWKNIAWSDSWCVMLIPESGFVVNNMS
jgi:hypothetical protein